MESNPKEPKTDFSILHILGPFMLQVSEGLTYITEAKLN